VNWLTLESAVLEVVIDKLCTV